MAKFKVGDKVRIREDLEVDSDIDVGTYMLTFGGETVTISGILPYDMGYCVLENVYEWPESCLEAQTNNDFPELKTSMVVKYRKGDYRQVLLDTPLGDFIVGDRNHYNQLCEYDLDSGKCEDCHDTDIVAVYTPKDYHQVIAPFDHIDEMEVTWKEPAKKMTLAEIQKELGYKVEVVEG